MRTGEAQEETPAGSDKAVGRLISNAGEVARVIPTDTGERKPSGTYEWDIEGSNRSFTSIVFLRLRPRFLPCHPFHTQ